jgi:hypothetical protein
MSRLKPSLPFAAIPANVLSRTRASFLQMMHMCSRQRMPYGTFQSDCPCQCPYMCAHLTACCGFFVVAVVAVVAVLTALSYVPGIVGKFPVL